MTGFVTRLYQIVLERIPDEGGLNAHCAALLSGVSAAEIANGFFVSEEFINRGLSDDEAVEIAYLTMLGREPDATGLDNWTSQMEKGCSISYVVDGFAQSPEFKELCAEWGVTPGRVDLVQPRDRNAKVTGFAVRLYKLVLNRSFDPDGLNAQCAALLSGVSAAEIANGFFVSEEFINRGLSDDEAVEIAYLTMLGREPDATGLDNWTSQMEKGCSISYVVDGFAQSPEFKELCAEWGVTPGRVDLVQPRDRNAKVTGFAVRL
ncbi:DUF4214 domain-containing protein, partial [Adlercreutzia sp. ZJ141]|uniref:DUF4214 domain-containing protein n=1 Tax=Adlercreutzia sp. ZJ141 TaxID=2709406 RepID=UPI0013EC07CA